MADEAGGERTAVASDVETLVSGAGTAFASNVSFSNAAMSASARFFASSRMSESCFGSSFGMMPSNFFI